MLILSFYTMGYFVLIVESDTLYSERISRSPNQNSCTIQKNIPVVTAAAQCEESAMKTKGN